MTSDRSIWHLDDMAALFIQGSKWFTSSDVHSWKLPEGNEHQSHNEHTSKYPSQIDTKWKVSPKRGKVTLFDNSVLFSCYSHKGWEFITFTATSGHKDKLFTNV